MTPRKSYAVLTISFAVVLVGLLVFAIVSSKRVAELKFSAGQPGGVYNPIARSITELIEGETSAIRLEVVESDGSAQNADRISSGEAQLALLQNDTPGDDRVRSLVPLQSGALHFLARKEANIDSLGGLEGKKVGVGLPTSGSHRLVTELLLHFEVDRKQIDLRPLTI